MARNARASSKVGPATKQSVLHHNMGRISKRAAPTKSTIKKEVAEKALDEKLRQSKIEILIPTAATLAATTKKNKRKAVTIEDSEDETPVTKKVQTTVGNTPTTSRTVKRARRNAVIPSSPDTSSTDTDLPDAPDTLLERLSLRSSPSTTRSSSPFASNTSITSACESEQDIDAQFPPELLDLFSLHAAFLKTISLQFAHNGTVNPINMENIYPTVSQAWGKRRVTLVDIQRCIGVLNIKPRKGIFDIATAVSGAPFYICDYGRGRLCIELNQESSSVSGPLVLNEQKLQATFEKNLRTAWATRGTSLVKIFVNNLPLAAIQQSDSVAKMAPINARGRQILQEIKKGIPENNAAPNVVATLNGDGSKMSLLDRIRARQQQRSQAGDSPSAAELARQAALQRAADVAAIIAMLSRATTGQGSPQRRISFTMVAILAKLRDSLSVPLSKEEMSLCVRLLASEVTPNWLRIVAVGGRENVVVFLDYMPSNAEVEKRAKEL